MNIDKLVRTALVAAVMALAAAAGVMFVKVTDTGLRPQLQTAAAATEPAQLSLTGLSLNGEPQYFRNCAGALAEAKNIGVLPGFATLDAAPARLGSPGENICPAATQSFHYDIAYFSSCLDGSNSCPVLARVTQGGQYVVFRRD
jgi:hypothetical protein